MCIQHLSEVRTDIVLVQIEVNDVVLLQLLHLQTSLLFGRHVAVAAVRIHTSAGTQHAFAAVIAAKTETLEEQTLEEAIEEEKQIPVDICNHALLVGYGRVGSLLGEKLLASDIPLVVIETSRTRCVW